MNDKIVQSHHLKKSYKEGQNELTVLDGIDFTLYKADKIAILGPSGSGKSTLLHLLGGLDKPSAGKVLLEGVDWQTVSEKERCRMRNQHLGFVYQFHHLLPEFSALENVAMPLLLSKVSIDEACTRAEQLLTDVGLAKRCTHKPAQLSGGERQRVAIARALIHKPKCVFADEPTGNLDQTTALKVFDLMLQLNQRNQTALVVVTHDIQLANRMDRVLTLQQGTLTEHLDG